MVDESSMPPWIATEAQHETGSQLAVFSFARIGRNITNMICGKVIIAFHCLLCAKAGTIYP
jgi:hypothetical protein